MAVYKLIQDVEAEDHILGPLTLRQFIFALIAVFFIYLSYLCVIKKIEVLMIFFLPPALFFGFFAVPFGRDQPTEIWALAKIRFWIKPRKRIWDQSGIKELVTITVPKKVEKVLTNGLNPYEVNSRLKTLAGTLDSRGWSIKNVSADTITPNIVVDVGSNDSDRLVSLDINQNNNLQNNVDIEDVMDENTSPIAQQLKHMINESSEIHKQQLMQQMNNNAPQSPSPSSGGNDQWFMPSNDSGTDRNANSNSPPPTESPEEKALTAKLKSQHAAQNVSYGNLRTLKPLSAQDDPATTGVTVNANDNNLTTPTDPAILSLSNDDNLTVATIAKEARKAKEGGLDDNEVVISLH